MIETILIVFLTSVAGLAAFLIFYARWHYGTLEKLGIPVAKPHFLLGSDPDGHTFVHVEKDLERYRKYGPVFGIYEGRTPRVFVLDPDMIRRIMVKDFDHFYDRSPVDWGHEVWDNLLDFLPGERWKTLRSNISPMFTVSRIRNAGKTFTKFTEKQIPAIKKDYNGEPMKFNMKGFMAPVLVEFTLDYFLSLSIPDGENVKDSFVYKTLMESVGDEGVTEGNFFYTLMTVYPFIIKLFNIFPNDGIKKFLSMLDHAITTRKETKKDTTSGKDFIDVMVSMFDSLDSAEYQRIGISKVMIQAQAFEMFIAGYDSILGTLSILPYYISQKPEIQEKLLSEIDDSTNEEGNELPYLTACVKEAIRISPSFNRLERQCNKDWTYTNTETGLNVTIPSGTSVIIPAWATNRNPEVFKDPEEFIPERFYKTDVSGESKQNAQYAMNSFGHGPRNCIGMKMGIEMVKAGMARMLREFKFELREDSKLELQKGIPLVTRYQPIYTNIIMREKSGKY